MRPDRRSTAAGVALVALAAFLVLDPLGLRGTIGSWIQVAPPASGPPRALAAAIGDRTATVASLEAALATDPILSVALLASGVGLGLLAGSTVAFLHQRRRIRRGGRDG